MSTLSLCAPAGASPIHSSMPVAPSLFETSLGAHSLPFSNLEEAMPVFEAAGHSGNGDSWQAIAQHLAEEELGEMADRVEFDSAAGMSCACVTTARLSRSSAADWPRPLGAARDWRNSSPRFRPVFGTTDAGASESPWASPSWTGAAIPRWSSSGWLGSRWPRPGMRKAPLVVTPTASPLTAGRTSAVSERRGRPRAPTPDSPCRPTRPPARPVGPFSLVARPAPPVTPTGATWAAAAPDRS